MRLRVLSLFTAVLTFAGGDTGVDVRTGVEGLEDEDFVEDDLETFLTWVRGDMGGGDDFGEESERL